MTMITPSYLGETIEYSSLHACRSTLEDPTERGRALGAAVLLEPCEGPAGWRSVLATSDGGEIALWQPKGTFMRGIG